MCSWSPQPKTRRQEKPPASHGPRGTSVARRGGHTRRPSPADAFQSRARLAKQETPAVFWGAQSCRLLADPPFFFPERIFCPGVGSFRFNTRTHGPALLPFPRPNRSPPLNTRSSSLPPAPRTLQRSSALFYTTGRIPSPLRPAAARQNAIVRPPPRARQTGPPRRREAPRATPLPTRHPSGLRSSCPRPAEEERSGPAGTYPRGAGGRLFPRGAGLRGRG